MLMAIAVADAGVLVVPAPVICRTNGFPAGIAPMAEPTPVRLSRSRSGVTGTYDVLAANQPLMSATTWALAEPAMHTVPAGLSLAMTRLGIVSSAEKLRL